MPIANHEQPQTAARSRRVLKIVLLPARPRILIHVPFCIPTLVLQCASPDLKQPHRHSWPNLGQLYTLVSGPHKDVMPYFYTILDVFERHNPITDLLIRGRCFSGWKEVLEYLCDPFAKRCVEVLKQKVRVRLAYCSSASIRKVVA